MEYKIYAVVKNLLSKAGGTGFHPLKLGTGLLSGEGTNIPIILQGNLKLCAATREA